MMCGYTTEYVLEHGMATPWSQKNTRSVQERNSPGSDASKNQKWKQVSMFGRKLGN